MPGVVESPRQNESHQYWGRGSADNPEMQRLQGLAGGFGSQYQGALGQQQASYDAFGAMAAGQGPSLAQSQLSQGISQAQQAAVQSALNARGGNAAGGQAAALQAATNFGGQAAMGAAQLAQQEQIAAMQAQAGMANQMAGQGLQAQMGLEGMYQQGLGAMLDSDTQYRLESRAIREQERSGRGERIRGAIGMTPLGWFGSDERIKTNIQPGGQAAADALQYVPQDPYAGHANPQVSRVGDILGGMQGGGGEQQNNGLGNILGLVGLLSDERVKQNIAPGNLSASKAVGELDPYTFEYEAGYGDGPGQRIGVMAQDMERAYPQAVIDTPQGKMINTAQGTGLALAASAEQEKRIRDLEQMLGTGDLGGAAKSDAEMRSKQQPQQPADNYQRTVSMGLAGPVPVEDTRAAGRDATQAMFSQASGQARQMDNDAAALQAKQGRPVSDESRRMAMSVGAAPQQRELGPNSLEQHDPNYGYREQPWSDSWQASPASAASNAMARIEAIEKGLASQPPKPQGRDPNWRFTQPQQQPMAPQGGLAGMGPVAGYNPTLGTYQGYDGALASNTANRYSLGGVTAGGQYG